MLAIYEYYTKYLLANVFKHVYWYDYIPIDNSPIQLIVNWLWLNVIIINIFLISIIIAYNMYHYYMHKTLTYHIILYRHLKL